MLKTTTTRSVTHATLLQTTFALILVIAVVGRPASAEQMAAKRTSESGAPLECTWSDAFNLPGFDGTVLSSILWDDGTGPALFVAGEFRRHGKHPTPYAARWNGEAWEPLLGPDGQGVDGPVRQLVIYDDGAGEALYAGGDFRSAGGETVNGVARWDGRRWQPLLGVGGAGIGGGSVAAMAVYDFGDGEMLTIGGGFATAGGEPANNVALWDGDRWRALIWSGGIGIGDEVTAMTVAMGTLFVAHRAGQGYGARTVLSYWDRAWIAIGDANAWQRTSLAAFDDGGGEALFVAHQQDSGRVSRWNGEEWSFLVDSAGRATVQHLTQPGIGPGITAIAAIGLGDGPALYLGGSYYYFKGDGITGISSMFVARWDGDWSVITDQLDVHVDGGTVASMTAIDDGAGRSLIVTGRNLADGATALGAVALWNRTSWFPYVRGSGAGLGGAYHLPRVVSMTSFDEGAGPALFAAGGFTTAGDRLAVGIARWRDGEWSALVDDHGNGACAALGCEDPIKLVNLDDDPDRGLYAVGTVSCHWNHLTSVDLVRWNGSGWSRSGGTTCSHDSVNDVAVFDDGTGRAIFGCGLFASSEEAVMKLSGTAWEGIPGSGGIPPHGQPRVMAGWSHGVGNGLYIAGDFLEMGGLDVAGFVLWDGQQWSIPEGPPGVRLASGIAVRDMIIFDDGTGEALYVGGANLTAGPQATTVVKWDGVRWWSLFGSAGRLQGAVAALAFFDDGGGPRLYAATNRQLHPKGFVSAVSRWDGDRWTVVGEWSSSENDWRPLTALHTHRDGDGTSLYVAGQFREFAGVAASGIAAYSCSRPSYGPEAVRRPGRRVSP